MARVKEKAHLFAPDDINTLDGVRLQSLFTGINFQRIMLFLLTP